jgi:hypothetical protein
VAEVELDQHLQLVVMVETADSLEVAVAVVAPGLPLVEPEGRAAMAWYSS